MKYSSCTRHLATILLICIFFVSACSSLTTRLSERSRDPKALSEARELISDLKNQNLELKTFKGIGRITFWGNDKKELSTRVAWVGSAPNRLRVALSSISGQPVVSLASDGQWLYLVHHSRGKFYKQSAGNSTMKRFFSIPIKSDDIVNILAGRIPFDNYDYAVVIKNSPPSRTPGSVSNRNTAQWSQKESGGYEDGYILVLKKGWGNIREKIYLDTNKKYVRKVEVFYLTGDLKYRAEFNRMMDIEGYRVPSRLVLSTDDGSGFQLDVDRYWAGVSVSQSMFVLTPPE